VSTSPSDTDPSTSTSRGPEQIIRDLAGGWDHHGDELDQLLDRVCSNLAQEANHELRQILTLLSTELELAQHRSESDEVVLDAETVDRVQGALERGTKIVGRYLGRSEVAKLMIRLDREHVDLSQVARDILHRADVDPEAAPIEIELSRAPMWADREKLDEALSYLTRRFWRARQPGGRFRFEVDAGPDRVDGFVGLDPAPMTRGDLVEKLEASLDMEAIGIDVPYVRAVIERHGGSLYVDRRDGTLGYGSELPRDEPESEVHP
jgi:light-regulated signal transduction histidine kinase (bacteriophytochrome)